MYLYISNKLRLLRALSACGAILEKPFVAEGIILACGAILEQQFVTEGIILACATILEQLFVAEGIIFACATILEQLSVRFVAQGNSGQVPWPLASQFSLVPSNSCVILVELIPQIVEIGPERVQALGSLGPVLAVSSLELSNLSICHINSPDAYT